MRRKVNVHASTSTDMVVTISVPTQWTNEDVLDWYRDNGANGEFNENGTDWTWGDVVDAEPDDQVDMDIPPLPTPEPMPKMTLQQFVDSRSDGISNIYYAGGALCIYRTDDPEIFNVILGNLSTTDQLHVCEKALYDDLGHEYNADNNLDFEPEPIVAGHGTHAGMTDLLNDYCDFFGIQVRSADELAVDESIDDFHRKWFARFCEYWDDIPPLKKKWICSECGEESIYWDASAYWDNDKQELTMSDAVSTQDKNFCGDCGAEGEGMEVEI